MTSSDDSNLVPWLPARDHAGHKGTFGTVLVLGGQAAVPRVMIGAPALSANAALRSGAGLAVLGVPAPIASAALTLAPSATGLALPVDDNDVLRPSAAAGLIDEHLGRCDAIAIGPGWGVGEAQRQVLVRLLASDDGPLVVDADALNVLAQVPDMQLDLRAPFILTPHPGEFRRLAEALSIESDPTAADERPAAAEALARRLGCVVVLKGAGTVVTDGLRTAVNQTGHPALATAGTGDVLTGMIAGLVAQYFRPHLGSGDWQVPPEAQGGLGLWECARIAVHAHGRAAERWVADRADAGLLAADLIEYIPESLDERRAASGGDHPEEPNP